MKPFVRPSIAKHNRTAVTVIACSMLLVLPGCLPALRAPLPARPTPQDFGLPPAFSGETGAENSARIPAREFFQDPNLTSLIDQALVGNLQLKIMFEDIVIANNEVLRRRGAYLPMLGLGASAQMNKCS